MKGFFRLFLSFFLLETFFSYLNSQLVPEPSEPLPTVAAASRSRRRWPSLNFRLRRRRRPRRNSPPEYLPVAEDADSGSRGGPPAPANLPGSRQEETQRTGWLSRARARFRRFREDTTRAGQRLRNRFRNFFQRYIVPWLERFRAHRVVKRNIVSLSTVPVPASRVLRAYVEEFTRARTRPPPPASGRRQTAVEAHFPEGVPLVFISDITGEKVTIRRDGFLGEGMNSVVYSAFEMDPVKGPQERAVKIYLRGSSAPDDPFWQGVNKEAFMPLLLTAYHSPESIYAHQRFLVASDILTTEQDTPIMMEGENGAPEMVRSMFLVFPRMAATLSDFISWLFQRPPPPPTVESIEAKRHIAVKLSLMIQVLQVLHAFHNQGLVHGDLTTNAFLLAPDGTLYLGHFMKVFANGDKFESTPEVFYNPYAAPEMLRSDYAISYAYSLNAWQAGLILYRIWCHKLPFGIPRTKPPASVDPRTPINIRQGPARLLFIRESSLSFDKCDPLMPLKARVVIRKLLRFNRMERSLVTQVLQEPSYKELETLLGTLMDDISQAEEAATTPPSGPIYDEVDTGVGQATPSTSSELPSASAQSAPAPSISSSPSSESEVVREPSFLQY